MRRQQAQEENEARELGLLYQPGGADNGVAGNHNNNQRVTSSPEESRSGQPLDPQSPNSASKFFGLPNGMDALTALAGLPSHHHHRPHMLSPVDRNTNEEESPSPSKYKRT